MKDNPVNTFPPQRVSDEPALRLSHAVMLLIGMGFGMLGGWVLWGWF